MPTVHSVEPHPRCNEGGRIGRNTVAK